MEYKKAKNAQEMRALLDETRASVKRLVSVMQPGGKVTDDNNPSLKRFCMVVEKVLRYGLIDHTSFFAKKDYWNYVSTLSGVCPAAKGCLQNVSELGHVKTLLGKGRAFVYYALMEKRLEFYLRTLSSEPNKHSTEYWYGPHAIISNREEVDVFLGFLVPLSLLDFNFCMRDIDFDNLLSDLGLYVVPDSSSSDEELPVGVTKEKGEAEPESEQDITESHFVHEDTEEAKLLAKQREAEMEREREREREEERKRREMEMERLNKLKQKEKEKEKERKLREEKEMKTQRARRWTIATMVTTTDERENVFSERPSLEELRQTLRNFAAERDWDQYHTPRNLCLAMVGEVGEVAECFQWKKDEEAQVGLPGWKKEEKEHLAEEMADVLLYLLRLADKCEIDLPKAAEAKIKKNAQKYPAHLVQGSAKKYTEYYIHNTDTGEDEGLVRPVKMRESTDTAATTTTNTTATTRGRRVGAIAARRVARLRAAQSSETESIDEEEEDQQISEEVTETSSFENLPLTS